MKYPPPVDENGKEYYVPIVVKNHDTLYGYVNGFNDAKDAFKQIFDTLNIDVDLSVIKPSLDSNRYNNILDINVRETDLSKNELKEYFLTLLENINNKINSDHTDDVKDTSVLNAECTCGFGMYFWENPDDIPTTTTRCANCGKIIIDYTTENCFNYEYDYGE